MSDEFFNGLDDEGVSWPSLMGEIEGCIGDATDDLLKAALNTGGQVISKGIEAGQTKKTEKENKAAEEKSKKDDEGKATACIAADLQATIAMAEYAYAENIALKDHSPNYVIKAASAKAAYEVAANKQDSCAANVSANVNAKRLEAAQNLAAKYAKESTDAASTAAANPGDPALADKAVHANMYVIAAQGLIAKIKGIGSAFTGQSGQSNIMTIPTNAQMQHHGMPTWGWVALGGVTAGALTGLVIYLRSRSR